MESRPTGRAKRGIGLGFLAAAGIYTAGVIQDPTVAYADDSYTAPAEDPSRGASESTRQAEDSGAGHQANQQSDAADWPSEQIEHQTSAGSEDTSQAPAPPSDSGNHDVYRPGSAHQDASEESRPSSSETTASAPTTASPAAPTSNNQTHHQQSSPTSEESTTTISSAPSAPTQSPETETSPTSTSHVQNPPAPAPPQVDGDGYRPQTHGNRQPDSPESQAPGNSSQSSEPQQQAAPVPPANNNQASDVYRPNGSVHTTPPAPAAAPEAPQQQQDTDPNFQFPLVTDKKTMDAQPDEVNWCQDSDKPCHHHYSAADLGVPEGTEVISPVDGLVTNVVDIPGNEFGSNVEIEADNGRGHYYLTHMHIGSIAVTIGQHITQGQRLGAVGSREEATASPHLHMDKLPAGMNRMSCNGAECSNYPFDPNIQTELVAAYQLIPDTPEDAAAQANPTPAPIPAPAPETVTSINVSVPTPPTQVSGNVYRAGRSATSGVAFVATPPLAITLQNSYRPGHAPEAPAPAPAPEAQQVDPQQVWIDAAQEVQDRGGEWAMQGMILKFFLQQGFTPEQSAAWVGNIFQESSFQPDKHQNGGTGIALIQWDGSRKTAFLAEAERRGVDWRDPNFQFDYVMLELNTTEIGARDAIRQAVTLHDATVVICRRFERAGDEQMQHRLDAADNAFQALLEVLAN